MAEKSITTVSILDPAIDWIATPQEDVRRFVNEERENTALLKPHANQRPTLFTMRVIPHDVAAGFISDRPTDEARYLAAFRASLLRVTNGVDGDGKTMPEIWQPLAVRDAKRSLDKVAALLTDVELEMFDAPTIQELGAVAWSRYAFFLRGTVRSWLLPQSVLLTWTAVRSRSPAAPELPSAATGASE